ncbi:hypothetical protein [Dactylosporangium sp. CA-092794]|uniref:hypothetical protein n=1 Tax=Dactylosporangium sp. CA-092794 TaxID=3239929 RepID=UPI003D9344E5
MSSQRNWSRWALRAGVAVLGAAAVVAVGVMSATAGKEGPRGTPAAAGPTGKVPAGFASWTEVMALQDRLNRAGERVLAAAHGEGGEGFGAIVADPEQRKLQVYWKGTVPAPVEHLFGQLRADVPVEVRPARYSAAELRGEMDRLLADPAAQPLRISSVAPLADASGLHIGVERTATVAAQATAAAAVRVPVQWEYEARTALAADRWHDTAPFWGGSMIESNIGTCTSGFAVSVGGQKRLLTAGHCVDGQDLIATGSTQFTFGEPRQNIGFVQSKDALRDVATFQANSDGKIYTGPNTANTSFFAHVVGTQESFKGNFVCVSGALSGAQCPDVKVTLVDESFTTTTGQRFEHMVRAESQSHSAVGGNGDSGAPVYVVTTGAFNVLAMGTFSATRTGPAFDVPCPGVPAGSGRSCSWSIDYAPINGSLAALGASIITG